MAAQKPSRRTATQPFKTLYTISFCLSKLLKLPLVLLCYIIPALRPHSEYTYRISVWTTLLHWTFDYLCQIEYKDTLSLTPGPEGDRFVVLTPTTHTAYTQIAVQNPRIQPTRIGAVWYPTPVPNSALLANRKVILYIHGGGAVLYGAREYPYGPSLRALAASTDALVFAPEYRLASGEHSSCPAQLQDTITAYRYLLDKIHVDPASLYVAGDSGGGGIVISFLRLIASQETGLPLPAGAMLWSPWVDLVDCLGGPNPRGDTIPDSMLHWGGGLFLGGLDAGHEYASPLRAPFKVPIPIWVSAGANERHCYRIESFVEEMHAAGDNIRLHTTPAYPHDLIASFQLMGAEKQFDTSMEDLAEFLGWELKAKTMKAK